MRNFIILFQEKEGTTALSNLLSNINGVEYISHRTKQPLEPLNKHHCGEMKLNNYYKCINWIYNNEEEGFDEIDQIYFKSSGNHLAPVDKNKSVGFKLRLWPPKKGKYHRLLTMPGFENSMINILKKNNVVVFLAVRQDIFRWALSKYHGDGTGKKGHIQFKLASGKVKKEDLKKIKVNPLRFRMILQSCKFRHWRKKSLFKKLKRKGLEVYPITYEDFLADNKAVLKYILDKLNISEFDNEIDEAINKGTKYKKVHSNDISEFVINHEEVMQKFGHRFISWDKYKEK